MGPSSWPCSSRSVTCTCWTTWPPPSLALPPTLPKSTRCSPCRASTPAFSSTLPRSPPTSRPRGPSSPTSKALTSPATTVTTTSTSSSSQSTINDIVFLLCYYIFIQLDHATKKKMVCALLEILEIIDF